MHACMTGIDDMLHMDALHVYSVQSSRADNCLASIALMVLKVHANLAAGCRRGHVKGAHGKEDVSMDL